MSKQFDFDFELFFQEQYDSNAIVQVINDSDVPDKTHAFQQLVQDEIAKIKNVLSLYKGVNSMSSFFEHSDKRFKISVQR